MSDEHPITCQHAARSESCVARLAGAADPLGRRRAPKSSRLRALLGIASRTTAQRTMRLSVLLVLVVATSEARAFPPFGGPPMGGPPMGGPPMGGPPMGGFPMGGPPMGGFPMGGSPMGGSPMGGMMGAPRLGPGAMPGGPSRPPGGPGMGMGRPPGAAPGLGGRPGAGAGRPPAFAGNRPPLGSRAASLAPGGAGGNPAGRGLTGAGGRTDLGRGVNPRHGDWYRGGWANARGAASSEARNSDWYRGGWSDSQSSGSSRGREAEAAGWGFYAGSTLAGGYGSGYGSDYGSSSGSGYGSSYDSEYGSGYGSGYGTSYDSGYGASYASATSDASSATSASDGDSASQVASGDTGTDGQQDGAASGQGVQTTDAGTDGTKTSTDSAADRADQAFDRARDAFKAGDYAAALELTDAALRGAPDDPLVHEFKALALFALGDDARAAGELHGLLARRPGMDWATLSGLYPDVETYTGQLRALEERCRQDPKAAAPRFVLAYHYLAAGHKDAAVAQLKAVLYRESGDRVARRLLAWLVPAAPAPAETPRTDPDGDGGAGRTPPAAVVGRWRGARDGSTFDLSLDDQGRFRWQAAREGKATATISGSYALSGDTLTLKAGDRPPLRASLAQLTPNSLRLKTAVDIPGDPGLAFRRVVTPTEPGPGQRENR